MVSEPDPATPESELPPPEPDPAKPEPEAPTPAPTPATPPFDLPTARQVAGRGLQLALEASGDIRRASIYVGLLVFAVAAPFVMVVIANLPAFSGFPLDSPESMTPAEATAFASVFLSLLLLGAIATLGLLTVSVDGAIMAVALLGGRAVGRPMRLREALVRARQVFWRYGLAAFLVGLLGTITILIVEAATGAFDPTVSRPSTGARLLTVFLGTLVEAPFGYVQAAIILGDVDAMTSLRRSVGLARARPRLAAAVAAFAFLASALQTFGLGAALELADRIGTPLHPSFETSGIGILVVLPIVAVALIAFGSLGITVNAIVAAPQVAAFLGLTHFSAGLDRARLPEPDPATPELVTSRLAAPQPGVASPPASLWARPGDATRATAPWVSVPMILLIGAGALLGLAGVAGAHPAALGSSSTDRLVRSIERLVGTSVTLTGSAAVTTDPFGDQAGGKWKEADLKAAEYAVVPVVPEWVLDTLFPCGEEGVVCGSVQLDPHTFDDGALVVMLQVASTPLALRLTDTGEWGPLFDVPGHAAAPSSNDSYALATTAVLTRFTPTGVDMRRLVYAGGAFVARPTAARSVWFGDTLLTLVPMAELDGQPRAWDTFASVSGSGAATFVVTRDWLRSDDRALLGFGQPPTLTFSDDPAVALP